MPCYLPWVGIACFVSTISVCFAQPSTVEKNELSRIKTLGVVSTFGDKFRLSPGGLFAARRSEHAIADWKVNDEAAAIVGKVLGRTGTYRIVSLYTDRGAEIEEAHKPTTIFTSTNFEVIGNALRALKPEPAVDAFIVIGKHRDDRGPWRAEGRLAVEGVGLYVGMLVQLSPLPGETHPRDMPPEMQGKYGDRLLVPFAFYRMSVIRASDLAPIASRVAVMPRQNPGLFQPSTSLPFKQIHASAYKDDFLKLTEDDKRVIRKTITELLEASIPPTLRELGFATE